MVVKKKPSKSADSVILNVLLYEFPLHDSKEAERKIRRRLQYYGLGPYQQERVDVLRRLKDEVQAEIGQWTKSHYFVGNHGKYAALEDFDTERLIQDLAESYPDVPREEIKVFIPSAVYLYYLR